MAPLGVALGAFALLAGAAASLAAAQAPAVAEATTDGAPNPSTLLADAALVDPKPADTTSADPRTLADAAAATSGAASWYASTADRRALRGCNPKKNTSCCRAPPPAAPPATRRRDIYAPPRPPRPPRPARPPSPRPASSGR